MQVYFLRPMFFLSLLAAPAIAFSPLSGRGGAASHHRRRPCKKHKHCRSLKRWGA